MVSIKIQSKNQILNKLKQIDNLGKVSAEDVEEFERLFKGLDIEEKNEIPGQLSL